MEEFLAMVSRVAEDELQAAREAALCILDRARRTRRELELRLREKRFSPPVIEECLARLGRVGLVDDVEFARAFVRDRLVRKAVGRRLVRQQLLARGVPGEAADRALEEALMAEAGPAERAGGSAAEAGGERLRARRAAQELGRRYARFEPEVRRRRLAAALARRGFEWSLIRELLGAGEDG